MPVNYQELEPVKIRIEPNAILLYNSGGPDRSIKREDFATGRAIPKRYRNRRLGDFLKELKLTEGHATGLPALKKAMQQNNSPEALFDFDDERTWFQVALPIHTAFAQKLPVAVDFSKVKWNIAGIDSLLNQILDYSDLNEVSGIAGGIAGGIDSKLKDVLALAQYPVSRTNILGGINLSNRAKNFETYIQPLVAVNWLTMTIPSKPTSPKQQYLTTLKGRLILELLKHKTNENRFSKPWRLRSL